MRDERTGEAFNGFGRRERVEHVCTMLPEGAPGEYLDPERLFNAVEMAEKRSDARPAKKIMVALPREFDARERFRALEDFISWNITANGYACTYAIHTDKDGRNPHAHILVANRRIDPKTGRWAAKSRSEFALDANGRRIPVIDPDTGRQKIGARNRKVWKRVNVSNNPLDSKEFLERLRREWADSCNALLPGYAVIDHRSFKARGIERIPTIHEGYASREMEKRGGRGDLCEENRRIQALNRLLDALRAMIGRLSDQAQGIPSRSLSWWANSVPLSCVTLTRAPAGSGENMSSCAPTLSPAVLSGTTRAMRNLDTFLSRVPYAVPARFQGAGRVQVAFEPLGEPLVEPFAGESAAEPVDAFLERLAHVVQGDSRRLVAVRGRSGVRAGDGRVLQPRSRPAQQLGLLRHRPRRGPAEPASR